MSIQKLEKAKEKLAKIEVRKTQILEEEKQAIQEIAELEHGLMNQTLNDNQLTFEQMMKVAKHINGSNIASVIELIKELQA